MTEHQSQGDKELLNYPSVSHTVLSGKQVLGFGVLMISACVACVLIWQGVIVGRANAPLWVIGTIGVMLGIVGLMMTIYGLTDLRSDARKRLVSQTHPNETWRADYDWSAAGSLRGMKSRTSRQWWKHVLGPMIVIAMAVVSNWLAIDEWGEGIQSWFLVFMSLVMNLIVLLVLGVSLYRLTMQLRYGSPRIRFERVPVGPGGQLRARIATRGLRRASRFEFTLREVEEEYIERQTGRGRPKRLVVCRELCAIESVFEDAGKHLSGDGTLPIEFEIPSGARSSELSMRPARFWDLEVRGVMRGVDFVHRFAIPIYGDE